MDIRAIELLERAYGRLRDEIDSEDRPHVMLRADIERYLREVGAWGCSVIAGLNGHSECLPCAARAALERLGLPERPQIQVDPFLAEDLIVFVDPVSGKTLARLKIDKEEPK